MCKVYLGVDIGFESVKGIIIDDNNTIIASEYLCIVNNSLDTAKRLISILKQKISDCNYNVVALGTTGVARKLIGTILGADVIKNEIISHTVGITSIMPKVRTVVDIGGQDIKIINVIDGKVINYNIYNLYGLDCEGNLLSVNDEIIIECLTDICKNETLIGPISIQGGGSKNEDLVGCIKKIFGENIYIDKISEFLGALGVARLAKNKIDEKEILINNNNSFEIEDFNCGNYFNGCDNACILKD